MVKIFGDKCREEGDRLWSENGDECLMGVNKIFANWEGGIPQFPRKKTLPETVYSEETKTVLDLSGLSGYCGLASLSIA